MTTPTLVSKSGAEVIQLADWVASKNDPAITELFNQHLAMFQANTPHVPMVNPAMDSMFDQFFADTNQELV
jgi:hypothetical protein